MKKIIAMLFLACSVLAVAAVAAGSVEDPLASLSYLTGAFTSALDAQVDQRLDESDRMIAEDGADLGASGEGGAAVWTETRLKRGDLLTASTGTNMMLLAGEGQIAITAGAVVDVTTGTEVPAGSAMAVNHRYMAVEDTSAVCIVTSKTAVVSYQGPCGLTKSGEVDYNAMAAALKQLNLFRGTFTGYGEGYDLEKAPTRLQALIMFIRVLGEEERALSWSGTTPFTDVEIGSDAEKYVGYAYEQGYTNGFSATRFRPSGAVNAYQYTEFVLRAMGYSTAANTNLADTLDRARIAGVLTAGETSAIRADKFLRADLVYISYYALDALMPDGERTLGQTLADQGVFTERAWLEAKTLVTSQRM